MLYSTNAAQKENHNEQEKISFCRNHELLRRIQLYFGIIAIFIVYAFTSSGLTWSGVMNVFRHSAVIGIIGIGMGLVCLTGEIDLSVGACWHWTVDFLLLFLT